MMAALAESDDADVWIASAIRLRDRDVPIASGNYVHVLAVDCKPSRWP
jgi:hypothetical protein